MIDASSRSPQAMMATADFCRQIAVYKNENLAFLLLLGLHRPSLLFLLSFADPSWRPP
jgi:hypothetical protein